MAKPRYKSRKFKPKKEIKKRKTRAVFKSRVFWDIVLAVVLIGSVCYLAFFSSLFKINNVKIMGRVQGLSLINQLGANILFLDSSKIEKQILNQFSELMRANLKKRLPDSLVLKIEKREPAALWCDVEENCFLIDSTGVIFRGLASENLLKIVGHRTSVDRHAMSVDLGGQAIDQEKLAKILKINSQINQKIEIGLDRFILKQNDQLDLKTSQNWLIYFDLEQDIDLALTKLSLLIEQEIPAEQLKNLEYIDLRFSKAYYR